MLCNINLYAIKSIGDAAFLQIVPNLFFQAADTHSALIFLSQIVLIVFDWNVKRLSLSSCATENNN